MKSPLLLSVPLCPCIVNSVCRRERERWPWPPGVPVSEFLWSEGEDMEKGITHEHIHTHIHTYPPPHTHQTYHHVLQLALVHHHNFRCPCILKLYSNTTGTIRRHSAAHSYHPIRCPSVSCYVLKAALVAHSMK